MKTHLTILLVFALATVACEQQKSGPVAESPDDESAPTQKQETENPAPDPAPSTDALYATAGPEGPVPVDQSTDVMLKIRPADGFKINKRFSWKFDFESIEGVDVETTSVGKDDIQLEDSGATIPVKLKAKKAGDHRLVATGDFSVCNDSKCELYRDETVAFEIAAAPDSN